MSVDTRATPPEAKSAPPKDQALRARNMLVLAHALQHIVSTSLPPLMIFIHWDTGLSLTQLGFVVAAASITSGLCQYPAGLLVDRVGPKRILVLGYLFTLSGLFLLSRADVLAQFITAQVLYGMGNSTFHPASFADVAHVTRHRGLGMGMALHNIGGNMGAAVGYSVSALLATWLGWRSALVTLVVAGIILVLLFARFYPDLRSGGRPALRHKSSDSGQLGRKPALQQWTPVFVIAAAGLLSGIFGNGLMTWLPTFFATTRGSTAAVAGMFSTIMLLAGAGGSLTGGKLGDLFGRPNIILFSTILTAGLIMWLVNSSLGMLALIMLLIATGFSHSLARPCLNAITSEVAPEGKTGSVFGLVFGMMSIGGSLASPLVGYLADRFSLNLGFMVIAVFFLLHGVFVKLTVARTSG